MKYCSVVLINHSVWNWSRDGTWKIFCLVSPYYIMQRINADSLYHVDNQEVKWSNGYIDIYFIAHEHSINDDAVHFQISYPLAVIGVSLYFGQYIIFCLSSSWVASSSYDIPLLSFHCLHDSETVFMTVKGKNLHIMPDFVHVTDLLDYALFFFSKDHRSVDSHNCQKVGIRNFSWHNLLGDLTYA